jgi:hypothetical protein
LTSISSLILHARYFCAGLCPLDEFVKMMEPIIEDESFYQLSPSHAVELIQHHHRPPVRGVDSRPLVFVFVDETHFLIDFYAKHLLPRAAPSDSPLESLKVQEDYGRECWPLEQAFRAIGNSLSGIPEFHCLITSVDDFSLMNVGAFRFIFTCVACSSMSPDSLNKLTYFRLL